jgi:hypothetical protein
MRHTFGWLLSLAGFVVIGASGCRGSTDCCLEGGTQAVVRGSVVDSTGAAAAAVSVTTTGSRYDCGNPLQDKGPASGSGLSQTDGTFSLSLGSFLGGPGTYCVSLVAAPPGEASDTIPDVPVRFFEGAVLDTTDLVLALD